MFVELANLALVSWLMAAVVMAALWFVHLKIKNAAIVDVGWAGNFTLIAILGYVLGDGYPGRKLLISFMVILWSARLAYYLFRRTVGHEEEGRYKQLRQQWGEHINRKFFVFFQFQAGLNVILSLPFFLAYLNPTREISPLEWFGLALWLVALIGEALADKQLSDFKSNPENRGQVCRVGLWRYSRHPNYFFEWLIWAAYFVFALASPLGWLAAISPLLMLYFLFKLTGIPATETQALRSKGEAYREYQRTTSTFVPWFPKK
jgi:steroid 5-alpha reductase family enzyme